MPAGSSESERSWLERRWAQGGQARGEALSAERWRALAKERSRAYRG